VIVRKTPDRQRIGKYLIVEERVAPERRTKIWTVYGSDDLPLGDVCWYSHWRQYTFWPLERTVLNATCLDDIAKFTKARTAERAELQARKELADCEARLAAALRVVETMRFLRTQYGHAYMLPIDSPYAEERHMLATSVVHNIIDTALAAYDAEKT
jgi:hypothetical protein